MAVCVGPCAAAFLLVRLLLQKGGAGRGKSHILAATILTAWAQVPHIVGLPVPHCAVLPIKVAMRIFEPLTK